MLLEVGIMFTAYCGARAYEKYRKSTNNFSNIIDIKSLKSLQMVRTQKNITVNPAEKQSQQNAMINLAKKRHQQNATVNPTEKRHQHYYQMSLISMGLSAIRQFFYPQLWLLSLCLYIYIALPQIREVEKSLTKERKVNVDVLFLLGDSITLAINQYFAAAFSVFLFHRGRKTLAKAKGYSEKMLFNVFDQQPRQVWLLKDNIEVETPLETVKVNDILIVNTGEVIPVDGTIVEGIASIDQHALTGESQPIEKSIGDRVFAATVVITGKIYLKTEKSGEDTTIAKIGHILNNSINVKSGLQLKGEEWANQATLPMLGMAGLIFPILGPINTVIFINSHIGYRIRIFAPLGTLNHISLASHTGILCHLLSRER